MNAPRLHVAPWVDVVVDTLGHDPRSPYVERFWLPVLGPSTTWLLRRFADRFDSEPDGFDLDPRTMARTIGIGSAQGAASTFRRTLDRCARFAILRAAGPEVVVVRRKLAPLNRGQVQRLPAPLQAAHQQWQDEQLRRTNHPSRLGHATRLARSLLDVGATLSELDDQLRRWDFDDSTVRLALDAAVRAQPADLEDEPLAG